MENPFEIWDQCVGCNICGMADWAENYNDDPTLFHAKDCPMYGNRQALIDWCGCDIEWVESQLGKRVGI